MKHNLNKVIRNDIQGLRALSVLSVIMFHSGLDFLPGGFLGVDIFFAISGFLMTSILWSDLETGTYSFKLFFLRRVRRIVPATFMTLGLTVVASWFILLPKNFEDLTDVLGASVLFLSNAVLMNQSSGYFAETLETHPLLHLWSLSVEEQFYLFFPVLMLIVYKLKKLIGLALLLTVFLGSLILSEWYYETSPSATFFHLPFRMFEFLAGAFAFLYAKTSRPAVFASHYCSGIGLAVILISFILFDETTPFPSIFSLVPIFGVFLILISPGTDVISERLIGNRFLVFLGGISFSLYLLHQPLIALLKYRGIDQWWILLLFLPLLVTCSWVQKLKLEDPLRDPTKVSDRSVVTGILIFSLIFLGLAYLAKENGGFPDRFDGNLRAAVSTSQGSPFRSKCHTDGADYRSPSDSCVYFDGTPTWAVLGDSHGIPVAYALAEKLRSKGVSLTHLTFSGCGFQKPAQSHCRKWLADSLEFLKSHETVTHVVLSFRLLAQLYGKHSEIFPEIPSTKSQSEINEIVANYARLVSALEQSGKVVIWLMQPPEVGSPMNRLIQTISASSTSAVSVSRDWWVIRSGDVRSYVAEATSESTLVFWPEEKLCSTETGNCMAIRDSVSLYRDQDHLSVAGARIVLDNLFEKFPNLLD